MLLSDKDEIKLADLGGARMMDMTKSLSVVGSFLYMSPEMLEKMWDKNVVYSFPTDIWFVFIYFLIKKIEISIY
jgi:serine/threonine protein kinase